MFKKLPSEVYAEDAHVLQLLRIEELGTPEEERQGGDEEWQT